MCGGVGAAGRLAGGGLADGKENRRSCGQPLTPKNLALIEATKESFQDSETISRGHSLYSIDKGLAAYLKRSGASKLVDTAALRVLPQGLHSLP